MHSAYQTFICQVNQAPSRWPKGRIFLSRESATDKCGEVERSIGPVYAIGSFDSIVDSIHDSNKYLYKHQDRSLFRIALPFGTLHEETYAEVLPSTVGNRTCPVKHFFAQFTPRLGYLAALEFGLVPSFSSRLFAVGDGFTEGREKGVRQVELRGGGRTGDRVIVDLIQCRWLVTTSSSGSVRDRDDIAGGVNDFVSVHGLGVIVLLVCRWFCRWRKREFKGGLCFHRFRLVSTGGFGNPP